MDIAILFHVDYLTYPGYLTPRFTEHLVYAKDYRDAEARLVAKLSEGVEEKDLADFRVKLTCVTLF